MTTVHFVSWRPGIRTIDLMRLLTRHGVGLGDAHRKVICQLIEDIPFDIEVEDASAVDFRAEAESLGAVLASD